jgi:hypothetical protein
MDLDINTLIQTITAALVAVVLAIVAIVRGTVEEAAKAGAARHAEIKEDNANWGERLRQELEQVRGTERQELRFVAYGELWKKQRPLAVYEPNGRQGEFGPKEAAALMGAQSNWYFEQAGGLMLTTHVREFYFAWQDLLRDVAALSGWRARRSGDKPGVLFGEVLDDLGRHDALATLAYVEDMEGHIETWPEGALAHAAAWRTDIGALSADWGKLSPQQQFAVLQQVSSTLRTAMTYDVESRMR